MPKLKDFRNAKDEEIESQWSDDTLREMCTSVEAIAIIVDKLPQQRQVQLLSSLNLNDMLNQVSDFYLVYDAVNDLTKVHLLFDTGDKLGITDKLIQSALRSIDKNVLIQYINDKMLVGQEGFLLDGIHQDPAGFILNKYAIEKFNKNPPRLSAFESSFSMFYNQKNQSIKQQIHAVDVLDRFLSGSELDLAEVSSVTKNLNQTSNLFNTEAIENLVDSIQQARKHDSTTDEAGYSSDDSGYETDRSNLSN